MSRIHGEIVHHVGELVGPDVVPDLRLGRHNVGLVAALGDDIVNTRVLAHVLAHHVDAHVHQFHRVQGTAPGVGLGRGMRGESAETELDADHGHAGAEGHQRHAAGMPGEDHIVVEKIARTQHVDLANGGFLRGRAVESDGTLQLPVLDQLCQRERGAGGADAEGRVSAGVTGGRIGPRRGDGRGRLGHAGQRVEFRQDADHRLALAVARDEGGGHAGHAGFHAKAGGFQQGLQFTGRARFLQAGLGVTPDAFVGFAQPLGLAVKIGRTRRL